MHFFHLTTLLGWVAVLFSAMSSTVQYWRVRRFGTHGVSLATWTLFSLMGVFWTAYGFEQRSAVIILGSLPLLPVQLALVARLASRREWRVVVRSGALAVVFCAAPTLLWGWDGGLFGIGILTVLNRAPQIIELLRSRDAEGVSTATWLLGFVGCGLWVLYYQGERLWAALLATGFAGLASLTIAVLSAWRHAQEEDPIGVGEVALA